ncbi:MAG: cobalt ECF transporter T component CbiQ [Synergistetes bacterium]|nr:cobalt ECF transporter T component CbiQ [Synergistota bacterium]MDW8191634.1 cobalt ECF transporter T component CbiQ [Synergistota bacterium]
MDAKFKLVFLFGFATVIAISKGWLTLLVGFLSLLLLGLIYHINIISSFRKVVFLELFLLGVVFFLPFTYPGTPLLEIGPLFISYEGLREALFIFSRSSIILLGGSMLIGSSDPIEVVRALYGLGFPPKLVEITFLGLRYISVIESEYRKLKKAMKARAFKPRTDLHTYKIYGYLIGMLLVKSYVRAERVYKAMLARGFNGKILFGGNNSFERAFDKVS